jgi:hypothetical protein
MEQHGDCVFISKPEFGSNQLPPTGSYLDILARRLLESHGDEDEIAMTDDQVQFQHLHRINFGNSAVEGLSFIDVSFAALQNLHFSQTILIHPFYFILFFHSLFASSLESISHPH